MFVILYLNLTTPVMKKSTSVTCYSYFFIIAQAEAFDFEHYSVQLTLLDLSNAKRPTVSV